MKTSVSQKIIIQNFVLRNGEWQVSNPENTYFPPSASFTPKFSQLWHHAQVKHWENVSWLLSLAKECFWGFFFIWMMMMMIIIILFLLVCSCLRHRNLLFYCKTSSLILKEKKIQTKWAVDVFLAEPVGVAVTLPGAGTGGFPGVSSHSLGALLALQRHQHCSSGWFWGFFPWQAAEFGWLRVFDGSAPVPDRWD